MHRGGGIQEGVWLLNSWCSCAFGRCGLWLAGDCVAAWGGALRGMRVGCAPRWAAGPVVDGLADPLGVLPALLEHLEEAVLDLGGDLAVGLDEPVGQVVPEPGGLGDLWDAVGDQPGLVATRSP